MKLINKLLILIVQCLVTFTLLLSIYLIFVFLDYQGGFDRFIGTATFQPIMGGIISILSIGICFLLGLPIRFIKSLISWWTKNYFIAISVTILGILLLLISFHPNLKATVNILIDKEETIKVLPNINLVIIGWFLISFSTLHIFLPNFLKKNIYEKKFKNEH